MNYEFHPVEYPTKAGSYVDQRQPKTQMAG